MPSVVSRTFAPQHPFECPAPDFRRIMAWPPWTRFSPPRSHPLTLASPRTLGSRSHVPLPSGACFFEPKAMLADVCNLHTTHEHTQRAFRSSHASGALAPLHAGTNRCRLRWPKVRCRIKDRWVTSCSWRLARAMFHLRGQDRRASRDRSSKGKTRVLQTISRVPFSWRLGHPGRRRDVWQSLDGFVTCRPSQRFPSDAAPRRATPLKEPRCLHPKENPYASGRWLLRARPNR